MKKYILLTLFAFTAMLLQAHVNLIYPEGEESFSPGQEVTIEWEELVAHNTLNWDLLISMDGGETWDELSMDIDSEERTFNWIVPETPSDQARIKVIQDNENVDYEDESGDFTIMDAVGTTENPAEQISIYPNPAIDHLYIDMPTMSINEIRIFDLCGNLVLRDISSQPNSIDIEILIPGAYLLEAKSAAGNYIRTKFIRK